MKTRTFLVMSLIWVVATGPVGADQQSKGTLAVKSISPSPGSRLANNGVPVHVISKQLGHSNVAITAQYLNSISGADVARAISQLEWSAA